MVTVTKARLSVPIHISWLSFMHQIGKSHTGRIIKVVLASLLSPVSCASFPNVDDHSGCVLTLINLAAHHDKPGVWWEMAKSAGRECPALNNQGLSASCGDCCHCWSWFSTKVAEETAIPQICHSSKPGFRPEKLQPTNVLSTTWRGTMPTSRSLGAMRPSDGLG